MRKFWSFSGDKQGAQDVELRIEGEIVGDEDVWAYEWLGVKSTSPNTFRNELSKYKGKDITVWVDSWGGDVFAAAGIYNALKEHDGKITVKIDSKAVSAASVIAMAGDEVLISPAGMMMIHNPWTMTQGEAKYLRHAADVLDQVKEAIINAYQAKTGLSRGKISRMMDEETWMSARKAIADGFADGMLYADLPAAEKTSQSAFSFSRLAIQNSADAALQRFLAQWMQTRHDDESEQQYYDQWFFELHRKKLDLMTKI